MAIKVNTLEGKNKKLHPYDLFRKGFEVHPRFRGEYDDKSYDPPGPRTVPRPKQRKRKNAGKQKRKA